MGNETPSEGGLAKGEGGGGSIRAPVGCGGMSQAPALKVHKTDRQDIRGSSRSGMLPWAPFTVARERTLREGSVRGLFQQKK